MEAFDVEVFAKSVLGAVQSSNWRLLAALGVVGVVFALRKWGGKKWPFLATDRGGAALALAFGVACAFSNAFAAGQVPSLSLLMTGLSVGLTAAGGWSVVKKLIG